MKKHTVLLFCTIIIAVFARFGLVSAGAEEIETVMVSVSEASLLDNGSEVMVEGVVAGISYDGTSTSREILLKDMDSDTILAVRNSPGTYPDFSLKKGDKVSFLATVIVETDARNPDKKYLEYSSENGTVESVVISEGNDITYTLNDVTTLKTWEDMKNFFVHGKMEYYSYVKIEGVSYFNYLDSTNLIYRLHKNGSAAELADIKVDGSRTICVRDALMEKNVSSDWENLFFDEVVTGYPGIELDKSFYAVFTGTSNSYYNLVILDEGWIAENAVVEEPEVTYTNADIIKELAFAYDRQGEQIPYDQYQARRSIYSSPEDATAQRTIFLDCSSYVNSCYREAFGVNVLPYEIGATVTSPSTKNYDAYARDNTTAVDVVGYWEPADYTTDEERQEVVDFIYENLEIGDVLVYRHGKTSGSSGHVYIYIGDMTFMHCAGAGSYVVNSENPALSYDSNASEIASKGTIASISASDIFTNTSSYRYIFKATASDTVWSFGIIRPFARGLAPTEETLKRMKIAGLSMEKTASVCENSSLNTGDILTYTVTLENTNADALTGITITDVLPDGTAFVSGDTEVSVSGSALLWQGNVPGKTTVKVKYSVKITETVPGTLIKSDSTYVSGVKLGCITHSVSGYSKTQAALIGDTAIRFVNESRTFSDGIEMVKAVYKETFDVDIFEFTTASEALDELIDTENRTKHTTTEISKMIAPNMYGGLDIRYGWLYLESENDKTRLPGEEHLAPGDIIIADFANGSTVYLYAGSQTLISVENGVTSALTIGDDIYTPGDNIIISLLGYNRYAVLRPSMTDTVPDTDVKSIAVSSMPSKTKYLSGEAFDASGMVIEATLTDGSVVPLCGYTVTPQVLKYTDITVTVHFGNLSADIDVQVSKVVKSVKEASELSVGNIVTVEGIVAGVAHEGLNNDKELILKDVSSDTLMALRDVPYGTFPSFGYKKGDRIIFDAVVEKDTSSSTCYDLKKYLSFSEENGSIETTIVSEGNEISYQLENVTEIDSWEDMKKLFDKEDLEPYTYIKMSAGSYYHPYTGTDTKNYRIHKNASAGAAADIKPDGSTSVTIREDVMTANLGSDWKNKMFDNEEISAYPGTVIDKEFYAVYIGGNKSYYQLVILDEAWIYDGNFYIESVGKDKKSAVINIPDAGTYSVAFADYNEGRLSNVDFVKVTVGNNQTGRIPVNMEDESFSLDTGDKIMIFDGLESMSPECGAYEVE